MAYLPSALFSIIFCVTYINAGLLTGKPNHNEILRFNYILSDITDCVWRDQNTNLFNSKLHTFSCMFNRISQCVESETVDYVREGDTLLLTEPKTTYCGIIASTGRINRGRKVIIKIKTHLNHLVNIKINKFNFEWRRTGCVVHNMAFIDSVDNIRKVFCGKRLPWIMVTGGHEAEVHITVSAYRIYQLSSFYSSYKPHWFDSFAVHHRLYVKSDVVSHLNFLHVFKGNELDVINYYLISDPWQVLVLGVSWNVSDASDSRIVIHDGPGHLSGILVKYTDTSANKKSHVQTTAFSAMIQITNIRNVTNNIEVTTTGLSGVNTGCHMKGTTFALSSSHVRNTVCLFTFHTPSEQVEEESYTAYTKIYINEFTLNGPHSLVDDSPHNCHYGGMYISHLIDTSHRMVPICDNKYKLYVSGRYFHTAVLIVWFAKYTSGSIEARFEVTNCFTTYLELANYPNYSKHRTMSNAGNQACQVFACAPKEEHDQRNCEMIFITKSIAFGSAFIQTYLHQTLYNCIPEYREPRLEQTVSLKATFTENWPLGAPKTVTKYDMISKRVGLNAQFLYLYNATAVFSDVCEGMDNVQIMLMFERSVCYRLRQTQRLIKSPGNIHATSSDCKGHGHPMRHVENPTHLLFIEGLEEHTGGDLNVRYLKNCPLECRNYTFVLLILKRKQNRIDEYRLSVDNKIFIGLLHNGFRLTVHPPALQCKCDINVEMFHPSHKIVERPDKPPVFWQLTYGDLFTKQ